MRQYDITDPNKLLEYEEGYSQGFKAGMLAAADIAYSSNSNVEPDGYYQLGRHKSAEEIREAVNGNSNNS